MKRLFEIPIYALSPLKLDARVSKHILKIKKLLTQSNNDIAAQIIDGDPQLTVLETGENAQMLLALLAGVIEQRRKHA